MSQFVSTFVLDGVRFICRSYKKNSVKKFVYTADGYEPIFSKTKLKREELKELLC